MIHFPSVRRLSIGPLGAILVLWSLLVLLLGTLVSIMTNLSTVIASIGVVVGCTTVHRNIVGHSLAWCLIAKLLLGMLLILVAILPWVLRTLLVMVSLGVLATVPLIGWLLVSLLKTLLRISTQAGVASRSLPLELPLLSVHLLALIVDYNSTIHKFLKARVDIGHQLQLETIIQPL
jgi:hypothetical protein